MAYIKHSDEWWEEETTWIEKEFRKEKRKSFFKDYVEMQLNHCKYNGPGSCTERLTKVWEEL